MNTIPRIKSIDILRGFAVLGMLLMNIMGYAMNDFAYSNPMVAGGVGINRLIHGFNHIIADQKMMALFSILFGASVILFTDARKRKGQFVFIRYFSRNIWLFLFGFIHYFFIWRGDILSGYAILSVLLFFLRGLPAKLLLPLGLAVFSVSLLFEFNAQSELASLDEASTIVLASFWEPDQNVLAEDIAFYTGDYWSQAIGRWNDSFGSQEVTAGEELWGATISVDYAFRALGMMIIGMALFKFGILSAEKPPQFYRHLALYGLSIGYTIALVGLLRNYALGWSWETTMIGGRMVNNIATPFVAFGYIGLVIGWTLRPKVGQFVIQMEERVAAVGRTALSCYISQSLIGTFIFYGWGLGLYGSVNRVLQLLVVLVIWALQLSIAPLWLKHFQYGPLEWLWRVLTDFKLHPIRFPVSEN